MSLRLRVCLVAVLLLATACPETPAPGDDSPGLDASAEADAATAEPADAATAEPPDAAVSPADASTAADASTGADAATAGPDASTGADAGAADTGSPDTGVVPVPPTAPTNVTAVAGNAQATVSWSAPSSTGSSPLQGYTVTSAPDGKTATVAATLTTATVTGLRNGTAYTFTVVAANEFGPGPASAPSAAVTPVTVPGAPTNVSAAAGDAQATVSFSPPADDGGSALTGYTITSSGGQTASVTPPATSGVVSGLANGTAYTFTVVARNAVGPGPASTASAAVTPAPAATVPSAPLAPAALRGNGKVHVTWNPPLSDGGSPVLRYVVTASPGGLTATVNAPTTQVDVSPLTNGLTYSFVIVAENAVGAGAASAIASATPSDVPGVPTGVTATAGDTEATVSWTAPASDGGAAIQSYTVLTVETGATRVVSGSIRQVTLTGLTNGSSYTFEVLASNVAGSSAYSSPSAAVIPATVPSAPRTVFAVRGDGAATLTWAAPTSDGGRPITGYGITSTPGNVFLDVTTPATTGTVTGLTNGTSYTFTVVARNAVGVGQGATSNAVVPATVPDAPTGVVATAGNGLANLSWTAPASDGGSAVSAYVITASPGGLTKRVAAPATSAAFSGLTNGTPYTFTVKAENAVGLGPDSQPSASVTPAAVPDAPTNVTAVRGDAQAQVSWTAPANSGSASVASYVVTASPGGATATATAPATTVAVTGLTNGTAYTFTVVARSGVGDSLPSAPSAAVTPAGVPGAPTGVSAIPGHQSVLVSWSVPSSNGATISGYTVTPSPSGTPVTVGGAVTSTYVTGLTNGTAYTFTVVAGNAVGLSQPSAPTSPVTPAAVPSAPSVVGATGYAGFAQVSWSAANGNGSAITGYTVTASPGGLTMTVGNVTGTNFTGLTNGTTYTFTVVATSAVGNSPPSNPSNAALVADAPAAPTNVVAVRTGAIGQVKLTWTAPASDGGAPITSYRITATQGGVVNQTTSAPATEYTVTGLSNGVTYAFTVAAVNAMGSRTSAPSNTVVPASAPGTPNFSTVTAANARVDLTWGAPWNGGIPINSYTVTAQPGGLVRTVAYPAYSLSFTGLTNGTAYTFTIHATNDVGDGAESSATAPVTPKGISDPPTNVSATAGDGSAALTWTPPTFTGDGPVTGYTLYAVPAAGGGPTTVGAPASGGTVTGLQNGQTYSFTVTALNSAGESLKSNQTLGVTPSTVPGAPTGVTAQPKVQSALVSWSAPASNGGAAIQSYTVTAIPGGITTTVSSGLRSATVTGLTNGTAYSFTVHATNLRGDGPESTPSNAVTPANLPDAPQGVTAASGNTTATVSWSAPASDGGSALTQYAVTVYIGTGTVKTVTVAAGTTSTIVTGLYNGTTYDVAVAADNAIGRGPYSAKVQVTPATIPSAPSGVVADHGVSGVAWVRWVSGSNGGSPVLDNTVTATPVSPAGSPIVKTIGPTTQLLFTGLTDGTHYTFTVSSRNAIGPSPDSAPSNDLVVGLRKYALPNPEVVSFPAGAQYALLADLNADGAPDVVTNSSTANQVNLLFSRGDGTFQPAVGYATGSLPQGVATGDFDGDGKLDLAVANQSSNTVSFFPGNGDGTFGARKDVSSANSPKALAAGDFNGDGKTDLAVLAFNGGLTLLRGATGFPVAVSTGWGAGTGPTAAVTGYFNTDANLDLAVLSSSGVAVYGGDGAGGFTAIGGFLTSPAGMSGLATADFTGDGRADLVTSGSSGNSVSLFPSQATGGFGARVDFALSDKPYSVGVGDLNGDLEADLIVGHTSSSGNTVVSVLLGTGTTLGTPARYPVATNQVAAVLTGDHDGDGKADALVLDFGRLMPVRGRGDGTLVSAVYASPATATSVAADDLNGDGKVDLVFPRREAVTTPSTGWVSIFRGNGDGTFTSAQTDVSIGSGTAAGGAYPEQLTIGDLNGDGRKDLAFNDWTNNRLCVSLASTSYTFGTPTYTNTYISGGLAPSPSYLRILDIDGDGKQDIVTIFAGRGSIAVFRGSGSGTFPSFVEYPIGTGQSPSRFDVADVNGDGRLDLVTANSGQYAGGNSASVLLNSGTATNLFPSHVEYPLLNVSGAIGVSSVWARDMNGDGVPDIGLYSTAGVSLFMNNGNGTFGTEQRVKITATGSAPSALLVARDLDGDGNFDLVGAGGAGVVFVRGLGGGKFENLREFTAPNNYNNHFAVADVNGDGKDDVVLRTGGVGGVVHFNAFAP